LDRRLWQNVVSNHGVQTPPSGKFHGVADIKNAGGLLFLFEATGFKTATGSVAGPDILPRFVGHFVFAGRYHGRGFKASIEAGVTGLNILPRFVGHFVGRNHGLPWKLSCAN
jgi:hypothetical protein